MTAFLFNSDTYEAEAGETVLACLTRHGVVIDNSCQAGVCQSCAVRLVQGKPMGPAQQGLSRAQKERGIVLSCQQKPSEGMELTSADQAAVASAAITRVEFCAPTIAKVWLRLGEPLEFSAGQFFHLMKPDGAYRSYSVANLPSEDVLEFHVRVVQGGELSPWLTDGSAKALSVRGPFGGCTYVSDETESRTPLVLAGVGTGAAPLYGVLLQALEKAHEGPIHFLHGATQSGDLYLREALRRLEAQHAQLTVRLSALDGVSATGDDADGETAEVESTPLDQLLRKAIASSMTGGIKPFVYLCGDPTLVARMKRDTYLAGVNLDRIFSDPFVPPKAS